MRFCPVFFTRSPSYRASLPFAKGTSCLLSQQAAVLPAFKLAVRSKASKTGYNGIPRDRTTDSANEQTTDRTVLSRDQAHGYPPPSFPSSHPPHLGILLPRQLAIELLLDEVAVASERAGDSSRGGRSVVFLDVRARLEGNDIRVVGDGHERDGAGGAAKVEAKRAAASTTKTGQLGASRL